MKRNYLIKWFPELESTNNEAGSNIETYDNLSVIVATAQTKGKGQRGNTWSSEPGKNLTFSIIYKFDSFPASEQFRVSQAITLGLTDYIGSYGHESSIKWPNDIYHKDSKICGILIENKIRNGSLTASIAGIGFNINQLQWPGDIPNPISLGNITGRSNYNLEEELQQILSHIEKYICLSNDDNGPINSLYHERMYRKDEWHDYRRTSDGTIFKGCIRGVSKTGALLMEDEKGSVTEFGFKEIGYIL